MGQPKQKGGGGNSGPSNKQNKNKQSLKSNIKKKGFGMKRTKQQSGGSQKQKGKRLIKKHIDRLIDDENTTNSENSENNLYGDINWEENLEVDTTSLIDEFAPCPKKDKGPPEAEEEKIKIEEATEVDKPPLTKIIDTTPEEQKEASDNDTDPPSEFYIGQKLLINNYNTTEWQKGVIAELDWDENEILVHYDDSPGTPDEWISMTSQRIQICKESLVIPRLPAETIEQILGPPAPKVEEPKEKIEEKAQTPSVSLVVKQDSPQVAFKKSKSVNKVPLKKVSMKNVAMKKVVSSKIKRGVIQKKINRRLPVWKAGQRADGSSGKGVKVLKSKFKDGEQVLAKWSDHRMQKFPAVIKKVSAPGQYDVLFYDGFEKTILEENIFKTTEEEIAKYKHSKPSEADSFVNMDIVSKEERRQKKRKTFDGFLSESDLKRKRRQFDLNESESFLKASKARKPMPQPKTPVKPEGPSLATTKSTRVKKVNKKYFDSEPVRMEPVEIEIKKEPPFSPERTITPSQPVINDSQIKIDPDIVKKEEKETKLDISEEDTTMILDKYPMKITCHDGIQRKSVVIKEDTLPSGWTKHAIQWVEGTWSCFLFSPDFYAVHSFMELRKYFKMNNSCDPPNLINFNFPVESVDELKATQMKWPCKGHYRKWINKILDERKVGKKVRILPPSRAHYPLKRVRTLLPKYRSNLSSNISSPSKTSFEGRVWKCPKKGCDKKFRKENLLQMHIKHYHSEFKALAGSAPNVVDLALARSAESPWKAETPKHIPTIKRLLPKSPSSSDQLPEKIDPGDSTSHKVLSPNQNATQSEDNSSSVKISPPPMEERKSTIKTLLPARTPKSVPPRETNAEFMESESENAVNEFLKTPSLSHKSIRKHAEHKVTHGEKLQLMTNESPKDFPMTTPLSRGHKRKQVHTFEKLHVTTDSNDSYTEEEKISPGGELNEEGVVIERLKNEEVINCTCGFREEDGLMIQCEICLCWQHGICHGIEKDVDVPEKYVCKICLNPFRVRSSQKYSYARHYLTLGKLPRFASRTCKEETLKQREKMLNKSFEITENLQHLQKIERSISSKLNIAQQSDHPKLYLWSTNWDNPQKTELKSEQVTVKKECLENGDPNKSESKPIIPVPEAPIESDDCKLRLLDHIEQYQQQMESRLTFIQAQVAALESEDADLASEESCSDHLPLLKQAVYMLLRDLGTLRTATTLS